MLGDLHKGVSYIAVYGRDLNVALTGNLQTSSRSMDGKNAQVRYSDAQSGFNYKNEFHEAILFADKYAGHHVNPEQSPGAWVAFRENDAVSNARSATQKLKLADFTGDYTFLMERLPDKSTGVTKLGPDEIRYGAFARSLPANEAMRAKVDERFLHSLEGKPCQVRVIYFDNTPGGSFSLSTAGQSWKVNLKGGNTWQTANFSVAAPVFKADTDGAQVSIKNGESPLSLHLLAIERQ
jgi:hypothetical protein